MLSRIQRLFRRIDHSSSEFQAFLAIVWLGSGMLQRVMVVCQPMGYVKHRPTPIDQQRGEAQGVEVALAQEWLRVPPCAAWVCGISRCAATSVAPVRV
jgi:hypothetical protein